MAILPYKHSWRHLSSTARWEHAAAVVASTIIAAKAAAALSNGNDWVSWGLFVIVGCAVVGALVQTWADLSSLSTMTRSTTLAVFLAPAIFLAALSVNLYCWLRYS